MFLPNLWGHTLSINRRTHSSPPASGDSDDRIDIGRRGLRYGTRLYFRDRSERIWPAESFALGPPRRLAPVVCVARRYGHDTGLVFAPARPSRRNLSGPRYLCGRGVSKNHVTFIDARASERAGDAPQSRLACAGRGSMFQTHPSHRVFVSTLPLWTLLCFSLFASILQTLAAHLALHSTVVVRLVVVTRKCLEMLDW